jgi:hypothetical protein
MFGVVLDVLSLDARKSDDGQKQLALPCGQLHPRALLGAVFLLAVVVFLTATFFLTAAAFLGAAFASVVTFFEVDLAFTLVAPADLFTAIL